MQTVLTLLAVQGLVGAFDNLWHHEITERLPARPSARKELALHTVRELLYAVIFTAVAWATWHGALAWLLAGLLAVEVAVTLWDFLVEDRTRCLPRLERVLHTLLALNYGAVLAYFAPVLVDWAGRPTGVTPADYGWLSWLLTAYGAGVLAWGMRDAAAVLRLSVPDWQRHPIRAGRSAAGKRVLVTGATGFIGQSLTRALIERGDRPIVLARDISKAGWMFGPHAEAIDDLAAISGGRRIDAVVNLAGAPLLGGPWTRRRRARLLASRVETTEALVALMARLETRPEVLISGSAIGYYGFHDEPALTEADGSGEGFAARLCRDWEAAAARAEGLGVRVCRLRIGLVFGRLGGALPRLALPVRFGLGAVLGHGRQWVSWIHERDLVGLILFAIDEPELRGAVNATAPAPVTNGAFTRALGRRLRRPVLFRVPARPAGALLGELATLFFAGQKVLPARAETAGFGFDFRTLDDALDDLLGRARRPACKDCTVFFNEGCPICRAEIDHYRRLAAAGGAPLDFQSTGAADLAAFGLGPEDLKRRLYVLDGQGRLQAGVDAFAAVWSLLPRYRWAAGLVRLPLVRGLAEALYEGAMAPTLVACGRWRFRSTRL